MENYQETNDLNLQQNLFNFGIEAAGLDYLKSSAKWEKFMAIVNIVFISIAIVFLVFGGATLSTLLSKDFSKLDDEQGINGVTAMASGIMTGVFIFYALLLAVFLIPNIYRLKFANNCIKAIANNDSEKLTLSFKNLRVYSTFWGILTIISMAGYAFMILMVLIGIAMK